MLVSFQMKYIFFFTIGLIVAGYFFFKYVGWRNRKIRDLKARIQELESKLEAYEKGSSK